MSRIEQTSQAGPDTLPSTLRNVRSAWVKEQQVHVSKGSISEYQVNMIIETTGGSQPIRCHGHLRGDAEEIRRQIAEAQAVQPRLHLQPQPTVSRRRISE